MKLLKEVKHVFLLLTVFSFITATSLTSCREQKKSENAGQQEEHPTSEEHPSDDGGAKEEHPTGGEEHPTEGDEHPTNGDKESESGSEHPN